MASSVGGAALPSSQPGMRVEGNDGLCRSFRRPWRHGHFLREARFRAGWKGLIGVPGSVGGALRMNAGAYGTQIGTHVREVELYRAATGQIETLRGDDIRFRLPPHIVRARTT